MKKILTHIIFLFAITLLGTKSNAQYCTTGLYTTYGCTDNDYVNSFSTTGGSTNITNNNSGCNGGVAGYTFFSTMTHTGIQGQVVNWSFTNTPSYSEGYKIWVDFNGNGNFTDPGENVYASTSTIGAGATVTGNFTIPITAIPGLTRIRIRCVYATTTFTPCSNHTFGEVEDYNFMIVAATPCSGQPTVGTASITGSCPTTISLAGSTLQGNLTLQWQKRTCGSSWANITGASNYSYSIASQSVPTDYRAYMICTNSNLSDTSNIVSVSSVTPCYCASGAQYASYNDITNVTVGSLNNSSTCGPNTYTNFTNVPAPVLIKGTSVPFSVAVTNCGTFTYSSGTAIFIDYNHDGTFSAAERVTYSTTSLSGSGVLAGAFTVPSTALTGITGMRVINEYNVVGSSIGGCDQGFAYGETEDYLVNIKYAPTATGAGTYCSGDTVTLTASSTGYTNPIYLWKFPNNTYTTSPVITIPNIQTNQAGAYTLYLLTAGCPGNPPDTSGATIVNVNVNQTPPPPIVASNIVYCQGDVFDSIAIYGLNLKWYSVPVGGIGDTAKPQVNTSVFGTVTYYVSQTVAGCEGPRAPVTISVVPKPAPPQVVSPINYCQGEQPSPLTAIGQNIKWYSVATGGVGTPITPTPTTNAQGTFTWYASQTVAGCESQRVPVVVTVNYIPNALITITRPFVCQYDTVSLSYYGNADTAASYIWTMPNGATVLSGSGQGPLVVRFDTAGIQTVRLVVDNGGCRGPQASLDVPVHLSPRFGLDLQPDACVGDIINIAVIYPTMGIDNYDWNSFAGADVIYGAETAGPYGIRWNSAGDKYITVVATAASCKSLPVSDTIHIHSLPDATITASATTICAGDSITFSAPYEPGSSYQWLPYQFFGESNAAIQTGTVDFTREVILNVTNSYNCRNTDSLLINAHPCCEVYFPTAFTPNGDGKNDVFRMLTTTKDKNSPGTHQITSFRIENRWGQVVFTTGTESTGWDGTFNGVPQDMGTYYYYVKYKCADGKFYTQKGELTLIR